MWKKLILQMNGLRAELKIRYQILHMGFGIDNGGASALN